MSPRSAFTSATGYGCFDDHVPVEIPGWKQGGNIHGKKYGTWYKYENGQQSIVSRFDTNGGGYWARTTNLFISKHATPQEAASACDAHNDKMSGRRETN